MTFSDLCEVTPQLENFDFCLVPYFGGSLHTWWLPLFLLVEVTADLNYGAIASTSSTSIVGQSSIFRPNHYCPANHNYSNLHLEDIWRHFEINFQTIGGLSQVCNCVIGCLSSQTYLLPAIPILPSLIVFVIKTDFYQVCAYF